MKGIIHYQTEEYGYIKVKLSGILESRGITRNRLKTLTGVKYEVIDRYYKGENISMADLNFLAKVYLTVIRGTPVLVQLLIIYFVVFASVDINKIIVAVMAFGINSGAYVAEIFRSGIMSVDKGQTEAGRSLGLNPAQTMRLIIIPQAFKNVLPALINEMIVLLKETAIIGYIGTIDITKAATLVQSRTYDALVPLLSAAIFYLILVMILTYFMGKLERRLRKSDH